MSMSNLNLWQIFVKHTCFIKFQVLQVFEKSIKLTYEYGYFNNKFNGDGVINLVFNTK